jgi:hypothetical protein
LLQDYLSFFIDHRLLVKMEKNWEYLLLLLLVAA